MLVLLDKGVAKRDRLDEGSAGGLAFLNDVQRRSVFTRTVLYTAEQNLAMCARMWGFDDHVYKRPGTTNAILELCARGPLTIQELEVKGIDLDRLYPTIFSRFPSTILSRLCHDFFLR